MPLPNLLIVLWALWPLGAYPGGKLFAPLVFLLGLFALSGLRRVALKPAMLLGAAFIIWISLSAFWSPANEGLLSGQFLGEDFAMEASYVRIGLTLTGCVLFILLVRDAPSEKLERVPSWIFAGLLVHLGVVGLIAIFRGHLVSADAGMFQLTGQSIGRNVNLLALGAPLLLAGLTRWKQKSAAMIVGGLLLAVLIILALRLDGLAVILAIVFGAIFYGAVRFWPENGFKTLFNFLAGAVLAAPFLASGLVVLAPALAGHLPLSSQQRLVIWQATTERIFEQPIFGHGVNASPTWMETYASRPEFLEQLAPHLANSKIIPNHPHNMALQLWAETGLVGVLLVAGLIVLLGRSLPSPKDLAPGPCIAAAGLLGAALAYFAVSYSVWDESFWASVTIAASGVIVLHKKSLA